MIYVIGGSTGWYTVLSTVEAYDSSTDTWARKVDMPTARGAWASANVVDGKIYVIGGYLSPSTWASIPTVEVYDPGFTAPAPPPDLNGDGKVDIEDLIILIEHWGQDDPMCDIAPPPFGDGIVNVQDLEVLMSYWGQPVDDPTLIAHWALDEVQGAVAYDNAGQNDAFLIGDPVWQPNDGMVAGALLFDGIDDCISTDPVLNPADGAFSVLTWVKGGAPGQVVLSQAGASNWLSADPSEGKLMTNLSRPPGGRTPPPPLVSEFVVTDGDWHRVGFVWDGTKRTIYVDDIEVAKDAQNGLESAINGFYISTGKAMEPGTYWFGLIDEIRIYNRAVKP